MNDLFDPGPISTILFWDQHENSINAGNFFVSMLGYPDNPHQTGFYYDSPGSYHNGAGGLSYADGHAEIHRWRDPRTMPPVVRGQTLPKDSPSPNNPDLIWLRERSTREMR